MKKLMMSTALLLLVISVFAQKNYAKEEQAVIAAIKMDHQYFCENNYEKWADMYVHAPHTTFTYTVAENTNILKGWKAFSEMIKTGMDSRIANKTTLTPSEFSDFTIRVNGNMAWAHFSEGGQFATRGLEKVDGKWKLFLVSIIHTPSFKAKQQSDFLNGLAGEWVGDMDEEDFPNSAIKVIISPMEDEQYFSMKTEVRMNEAVEWSPAFDARGFYNPQTSKVDFLGYWKRGTPTVSKGVGNFGAANEFTMEFQDAVEGSSIYSKIKYTLVSENEIKVDRESYFNGTTQAHKTVLKRK